MSHELVTSVFGPEIACFQLFKRDLSNAFKHLSCSTKFHFLQGFRLHISDPLHTYGAALYEQVLIYANALADVGDPADRVAIGASKTQTAMGMVQFDPATHLAIQSNEGIPLQFYQIQNGERALFYPPIYATSEFVESEWMK